MNPASASPAKIVEVAVAVIFDPAGRFLLTRRPQGKPYAGYWEFPGGKIESGETPVSALKRELKEELGIGLRNAYPWITRFFVYPHAQVNLRFCRVVEWEGEPHAKEGQGLSWQAADQVAVAPMLPANATVLAALRLPPVYAITNAAGLGEQIFLACLDSAMERGLRLIEVREKTLTQGELEAFTRLVVERVHRVGGRVLVNADHELARRAKADGVHLTSRQLFEIDRRPEVGLCAASVHDRREMERAAELGADFVALGPVNPTPTHPGHRGIGWDSFARLIAGYALPVYALGGLCPDDLMLAQTQGAHGISMLRAAWPLRRKIR